jgi:virulence-associated protein VagC
MAFRLTRKPFRVGTSWAVTLPLDWCTFYADRLTKITMVGHNLLILAPEGMEDKALELIKEDHDEGE